MTNAVNLRELVVERSAPVRYRRVSWFSRYVLPGGLIFGFTAVLAWSFRDSLLPAVPVTVVPVQPMTSTAVAADAPLFRAAGWIEPRPTPVYVSALVEGVVDKLLVVEGQEVQEGQILAQLVKRDAEIAVEQAEAEVELCHSREDAAMAQLDAARTYWKEPIERKAALSEARANLAAAQTQLSRLPAAIVAAQSKVTQTRKEADLKTKLGGVVATIAVDGAKSDATIAASHVDELKAQQQALEQETATLKERCEILARQLELKTEEQRKLKDAEAVCRSSRAQLKQAEVGVKSANLRLERMTVKAPMSGMVLALVAKPGSRLMGIDRASLTDAATVLSMYDPHQLQVRADVRLEDVPNVHVGQSVRIETAAAGKALNGQVSGITSSTDIQKNTLQIKIAISDPPPVLKPDMLVEATFLAPKTDHADKPLQPSIGLAVPAELIDSTGQVPQTWIADLAARRARLRSVQLGPRQANGLIGVVSGLNVGDRLIASGREQLTPDCRIDVRGEAQTESGSEGQTPHAHANKKPQRAY